MRNYKEFLNTLIERQQIESIEALISHVLPTLDESSLEETRELMDAYMTSASHKAIVDLIASRIGVTEETSSAYLLARIADRELDRLDLDQHIKNLKGLYGHVLAEAIFKGDVEVVRLINESHAHRYPVNFRYVSNVGPCVDGKEISRRGSFTSFESAADVEFVFDTLLQAGLEQLLGRNNDGSAWILGKNLTEAVFATRSVVSPPTIPMLSRGQVSQSELALALSDRRSSSSYPELYDKILVWVDNDEVAETAGTPIVSCRKFTLGPEERSYLSDRRSQREDFDLKDYETIMASGKEYLQASVAPQFDSDRCGFKECYGHVSAEQAFRGISVGLLPKTETSMERSLAFDLTQYMLTPRQRLGLDAPSGMTLMMMDLDVILGYDVCVVDDVDLAHAQDFATAYFPLESLISLRDKTLVMARDAIPYDLGIQSAQNGFSENLFSRLADPEMASVIADLVPMPILDRYFQRDALVDGVSADDVAGAMRNLGFVFAKDTYTLTRNKAARLNDAGIRFADVSDEGFVKRASFDVPNDRQEESYLAAMQMGLWPGKGSEMKLSIKEALTQAMRLKQELEYPALLKYHGARKVAPHIKTEPQTRLFAAVFSSEEVRDCLHLLPKKMRETCLAGDLGL